MHAVLRPLPPCDLQVALLKQMRPEHLVAMEVSSVDGFQVPGASDQERNLFVPCSAMLAV